MRLLLDTHTLFWYVEGDQKLSRTAQTLIADPGEGERINVPSIPDFHHRPLQGERKIVSRGITHALEDNVISRISRLYWRLYWQDC